MNKWWTADGAYIEQVVSSEEVYYPRFGGLGNEDAYATTRPRIVGSQSDTGHSTRDAILSTIGAGLQTLNAWIVTRAGQTPTAILQQPNGQTYQQQLSAAQLQQVAALSQSQELASASANSTGLQIGGSNISWPTIALVGLGIWLLQSRGLTRR
jgi:hypothetical protein